ncbi:hypothetical protein [Ferrimonas marina]|uniref:Uncharacterized protein n=1 Tax=Ferrimonas marina TaxID=299255 RepID=A0A1M5TK11_9GAMM|nr:hypothetical protein [Ferrimonas marina]SHH51011.1 hypothetical protein SAMN02745129_2174 [Ferrimonas marina]
MSDKSKDHRSFDDDVSIDKLLNDTETELDDLPMDEGLEALLGDDADDFEHHDHEPPAESHDPDESQAEPDQVEAASNGDYDEEDLELHMDDAEPVNKGGKLTLVALAVGAILAGAVVVKLFLPDSSPAPMAMQPQLPAPAPQSIAQVAPEPILPTEQQSLSQPVPEPQLSAPQPPAPTVQEQVVVAQHVPPSAQVTAETHPQPDAASTQHYKLAERVGAPEPSVEPEPTQQEGASQLRNAIEVLTAGAKGYQDIQATLDGMSKQIRALGLQYQQTVPVATPATEEALKDLTAQVEAVVDAVEALPDSLDNSRELLLLESLVTESKSLSGLLGEHNGALKAMRAENTELRREIDSLKKRLGQRRDIQDMKAGRHRLPGHRVSTVSADLEHAFVRDTSGGKATLSIGDQIRYDKQTFTVSSILSDGEGHFVELGKYFYLDNQFEPDLTRIQGFAERQQPQQAKQPEYTLAKGWTLTSVFNDGFLISSPTGTMYRVQRGERFTAEGVSGTVAGLTESNHLRIGSQLIAMRHD